VYELWVGRLLRAQDPQMFRLVLPAGCQLLLSAFLTAVRCLLHLIRHLRENSWQKNAPITSWLAIWSANDLDALLGQ